MIELISIHIPKTGRRSLRSALYKFMEKKKYGTLIEKKYFRWKIKWEVAVRITKMNLEIRGILENMFSYISSEVKKNTKINHTY